MQETLTYKKVRDNKKIAVNKKNCKVAIKRCLKKCTYNVKVIIKANVMLIIKVYPFKTVIFKIKVK